MRKEETQEGWVPRLGPSISLSFLSGGDGAQLQDLPQVSIRAKLCSAPGTAMGTEDSGEEADTGWFVKWQSPSSLRPWSPGNPLFE